MYTEEEFNAIIKNHKEMMDREIKKIFDKVKNDVDNTEKDITKW